MRQRVDDQLHNPERFINSFERNVAKLERRYRSISRDLQDLFHEIAEDHRHRRGARRVPRLRLPSHGLSIWKYRCGIRGRRRGRNGLDGLLAGRSKARILASLSGHVRRERELLAEVLEANLHPNSLGRLRDLLRTHDAVQSST